MRQFTAAVRFLAPITFLTLGGWTAVAGQTQPSQEPGCSDASQAAAANPVFALPVPTGPFQTGTENYELSDASRSEPGGKPRTMAIQVWYPSSVPSDEAAAPYLPSELLLTEMLTSGYLNLDPSVLRAWKRLRTHSRMAGDLLASPERRPLVLFSHGFGMSRCNYTSLTEDLASHGYIVVAIDHPRAGLLVLRDGRVLTLAAEEDSDQAAEERVNQAARDAAFVVRSMRRGQGEVGKYSANIDFERVAILGHSLGGATALEACRLSNFFHACVDLDGDPWGKVSTAGVRQPCLVMLHQPVESQRPPRQVRQERDARWSRILSRSGGEAYVATIANTNHFTFSDLPFVVPREIMERNGASINPNRGHEVVSSMVRAFLSQYLMRSPTESIESAANSCREVVLRKFPVATVPAE